MIYVTVGTLRPFPRLIREMDRIAPDLPEEVIMQTGVDRYRPQHARWFDFCGLAQQTCYISEARVVVAHAGVGTVRMLANHGKRSIFVVRRSEYGEVVNDHQVEFATGLRERGVPVLVLYEVDRLRDILLGDPAMIPVPPTGNDSLLVHRLRETVLELAGKQTRHRRKE